MYVRIASIYRCAFIACGVAAIVLNQSARACIRTGTDTPCQCLANLLVTHPGLDPATAITSLANTTAKPSLVSPADASTASVNVGDTYYDQADITIQAGDTVQWNWQGGIHTVTNDNPNSPEYFDSGVLIGAGQTYSHTFTQPGTYRYYCSIHDYQVDGVWQGPQIGTVTVVAAPEPAVSGLALISLAAIIRRTRHRHS